MRRLLTGVEKYLTGASDIPAGRALLGALGVFATFLLLSLSHTFLKTLPPSLLIQLLSFGAQALLIILALLVLAFLAGVVLRSLHAFYSGFTEMKLLIRNRQAAKNEMEKQQLLLKQVLEEQGRLQEELNLVERAASQNTAVRKDNKRS